MVTLPECNHLTLTVRTLLLSNFPSLSPLSLLTYTRFWWLPLISQANKSHRYSIMLQNLKCISYWVHNLKKMFLLLWGSLIFTPESQIKNSSLKFVVKIITTFSRILVCWLPWGAEHPCVKFVSWYLIWKYMNCNEKEIVIYIYFLPSPTSEHPTSCRSFIFAKYLCWFI